MHHSPVNYPLALIPDADPVIESYARSVMKRAFAARERLKAQIANVRTINQPVMEAFPELTQQIAAMMVRVRNLEKGVPATESIDAPQQRDLLQDPPSNADKFLLKKAYRKAAALCHPDKGGTKEEFISVQDAYKAGDINALNAFVLSKQKNTASMIQHWLRDAARCKVAWVEFQSKAEFAIARLIQTGRKDEALYFVERILYEELHRLHLLEDKLLTPTSVEVSTEQ